VSFETEVKPLFRKRDGRAMDFAFDLWLDLEPMGPTTTKATYGADIRLHGLWRLLSPMLAMEAKAG
jgi:hypothetical protein